MKKTIGRKEKIDLKEWGISGVTAKIDTGAYTSSIHCEYAREIQDGLKKVLHFIVLSPGHKHYKNQIISTENFTQKKVKNSFGHTETRYKVVTKIGLWGMEYETEFTLSERSKMKNPILLGRKALKGKFLIDVDKVNLSSHSNKSGK